MRFYGFSFKREERVELRLTYIRLALAVQELSRISVVNSTHNHFLTHKLLCSPRENESTHFNHWNHNRRNSGNRNAVIHFHIFSHISAYFHTFPPRYLLFSYTCVNKFTQKIHFYVIQQWRHPFQDDFPTEYVAKKKWGLEKNRTRKSPHPDDGGVQIQWNVFCNNARHSSPPQDIKLPKDPLMLDFYPYVTICVWELRT